MDRIDKAAINKFLAEQMGYGNIDVHPNGLVVVKTDIKTEFGFKCVAWDVFDETRGDLEAVILRFNVLVWQDKETEYYLACADYKYTYVEGCNCLLMKSKVYPHQLKPVAVAMALRYVYE